MRRFCSIEMAENPVCAGFGMRDGLPSLRRALGTRRKGCAGASLRHAAAIRRSNGTAPSGVRETLAHHA